MGVIAGLTKVALATVALNQIATLAKVGHVLGEMAATFGDEVAKMQHHLEAHRVALIDVLHRGTFAQKRVHILAV